MKRITLTIVFVLLNLLAVYAQVDRSQLPEPGIPRPIEIGEYESFELKNGLRVFIIENHKLPRVSYNLIIDREPILELDKMGYLGMVGPMMRRGTETRTKKQIDEEVDFIGANLSVGSSNVFASGLSKYNEKILELMTDIVFNPTFPIEELEKIKKQSISSLAASKENPSAISANIGRTLSFGKDHPYGEIQTEETIGNIVVEDLKAYHSSYFRPNIAYLAVVGDVSPKAIKKSIKTYFGDWETGEIEKPAYKTPTAPDKTKVALVNRSSAVQSNVVVTYPVNLKIGSEDQIKTSVMNQILGGSSSAKLFNNLREDKGFTYGSYSSLSADDLVGRFIASAEVRNEVTDSAIVEMIYEMNQMRMGEISEEELTLAKNAIAGRFSRSLEQPQTVARFALNRARYNLPEAYYNTYLQKVQEVTLQDVKAMALKYLKPENAHITVVGKADEIASKLEKFGEVTYYNNYGDEVDPSLSKLPDGLTAQKVLELYAEALGGQNAIKNIDNAIMKWDVDAMGQSLQGQQILASGMKSKMEITMGGMAVMANVSDGVEASVNQMGNVSKLEGADKEEQIVSNALFSEFSLEQMGAEFQLQSLESINGNDAYGLSITLPEGGKYTLFFDSKTGLKVRYMKVWETPQGSMRQMIDYSDYKEVNGVQFPHKLKQTLGPQIVSILVEDISINSDLSENEFKVE